MVGLSDEAGAGANVGLAIKLGNAPTQAEVARMDEYVHSTLWGVKDDIPFPVSLQVCVSACYGSASQMAGNQKWQQNHCCCRASEVD